LDADDIFVPEFLAKCLDNFSSNTSDSIAFVTTNYQHFGLYEQLVEFSEPDVIGMLVKNSAHTSSLIKRDVFDKVNGYDQQFTGYMDWDLWLSIIERGYTWSVISEPLFKYRVRNGSMVTNSIKNFDKLFDLLYKKHIQLYAANSELVIKLLQKRYLEFYLDHYIQMDEISKQAGQLKELNWKLESDFKGIKNRKAVRLVNNIMKTIGKRIY
jgi:hypothetical protein